MKRLGTLLLLLLGYLCFAGDAWKYPTAWAGLSKKMTDSEVEGLLGSPLQTESTELTRIWYYQAVPRRIDDQTAWRPDYGYVRFKKTRINGQEDFLLFDWKQPKWKEVQNLPPPLENAVSGNPLQQLEQIQNVYNQQLQDAQSETEGQPSLPVPINTRPGTKPLGNLLNTVSTAPKYMMLIGGCGITALLLLRLLIPRRRRRRQMD